MTQKKSPDAWGGSQGQEPERQVHNDRFLPYRQFAGFMIPNCLAKYPDLSSTAKLVWGRLAQFAGRDGACFPAYETLAQELGVRRMTVVKAVQALVDKGFIERESRPGRSTKFHFLYHKIFRPGAETAPPASETGEPGAETAPPPGAQTAPPPGAQTAPRRESRKRFTRKSDARARAIPAGAGSAGAVRKADAGPRATRGEADRERIALLRRQADDLINGKIGPGAALPMPAHQTDAKNAI